MPDTLIQPEALASQPAPAKRCTKKRSAMPKFSNPTELVERILQAIKPTLGDEGEMESMPVSAKALASVVGDYTVADAVYAISLLKVAIRTTDGEAWELEGGGRCSRSDALCSALFILEDFASTARSSGPSCVSARAYLLETAAEDATLGEQHIAARSMLQDTANLRSGDFWGETFSGCTEPAGCPWWLMKATERRDGSVDGDELRSLFEEFRNKS